AHYYLSVRDSVAKFYSLMMLFMSAMLGIVLSDNLLLLIIFWELTSISSFLLVGYWSHKPEARSGARMALTVTGGGGLAMLAGFILIGEIAGTYEISQLTAQAAMIQAHAWFTPALLLILLGCFTKSAQFPFHFWLPDAMAAPTPVSGYLHSATMVKAGVFMLARLYPVLGGALLFQYLVTATGLMTLAFAAFIALFKHDLKGLLAYSTISHLGLIVFLLGLGSPLAAVAAVFHILNHATFKASLFMLAGIVDHETGTRDMRKLGGLWSLMPWTATLSMVAAASMAGVPLTGGFLSKEMMFTEAFNGTSGWAHLVIPLAVTFAGICSVAYSLRFVHDVYFNGAPKALPNPHPHEPPLMMKAPVAILVVLGIVVGIMPALTFGPMVALAAGAVTAQPLPDYYLSIWHGFNIPLLMSAVALVVGAGTYFALIKQQRLHQISSERWFGWLRGRTIFDSMIHGLFQGAGLITSSLENGMLQRYLAWFVGTTIVAVGATLWGENLSTGQRELLPASILAMVVWLLLAVSCALLVLQHHHRLQAVVVVGVVGLVTSLAFVQFSAPDLALTQLSVEVVTTVLLLMALALLPQHSPKESSNLRKWRDGALAVAGGLGVMWLAWLLLTTDHQSISWYLLQESYPLGGGTNVVNVILVDFRGYDTLGEVTVLAIAALGVLALMDGMQTHRPPLDPEGRAWSFGQLPLMLRVTASVALPMALVFSLYIFMRGHNMPGGGFIAGLITAVALVMQYMALGQAKAEQLMQAEQGRRFERWIAYGLFIAGLCGVLAFFFGRPFLTSGNVYVTVPVFGQFHVASAILFDLGVYLTVVGATLLSISTLATASAEDQPRISGERS
ncbi:MAG: monovalent cation/H+ antiporter subunit A, partial [Pseudomonadota bacterium]|nr:monovalent cation/H+ antiporter subunit A [Pseudomonadota bacterium]